MSAPSRSSLAELFALAGGLGAWRGEHGQRCAPLAGWGGDGGGDVFQRAEVFHFACDLRRGPPDVQVDRVQLGDAGALLDVDDQAAVKVGFGQPDLVPVDQRRRPCIHGWEWAYTATWIAHARPAYLAVSALPDVFRSATTIRLGPCISRSNVPAAPSSWQTTNTSAANGSSPAWSIRFR